MTNLRKLNQLVSLRKITIKSFCAEICNISGMNEMIDTLKSLTFLPKRDPSGNFVFAVDHCFSIKGQGTVMTGTVLNGSIDVNAVSEAIKLL